MRKSNSVRHYVKTERTSEDDCTEQEQGSRKRENQGQETEAISMVLVGVGCGIGFCMIVYYKSKKYKEISAGSRIQFDKVGNFKDIEPYVNPIFENNVLSNATKRLMMSDRPKQPKYARNKNMLVIDGSGAGKTRFFVKTNFMQIIVSMWSLNQKALYLIPESLEDFSYTKDGKEIKDSQYKFKM